MKTSLSIFSGTVTGDSCRPIERHVMRADSQRAVMMQAIQRLVRLIYLMCVVAIPMFSNVCQAIPTAAHPDERGTVSGRVTGPDRVALQGARVELQPIGLTAVSDAQGQFVISDVPAGNYTLNVSYLGFAPLSAPVSVTAGGVAQADLELKIEALSQQVIVRGERERGEIEALNRERTADTIIEVLPAEVITSLPNTNVADALGRLPGVSLERDEGEGKYIQIRGTEPRLSNVTINGVRITSPESDVRTIKLDVIPAVLVESIEVSKTLSANQDGDAIGGSVNLVTRIADDEPYYSVSGLYGYTPIINGRQLSQFDATVAKRLGAGKRFGVALTGSYDYNPRGFNNIEPSPDSFDFRNGPVPVFTGIHLREYEYRRHRYGFAGSVDYRLGNGSSAYLRGLFADFRDFGDTWNTEINVGDLQSPTASNANGFVQLRHLNRTPQQKIFSIAAGEKLNLGRYLLDYQVAVSRSRQDGQFPSTYFRSPQIVQFGVDTSNPLTPKFPVVNSDVFNINDPSNYTFTKTVLADDHVRALDLEGSVSLARHYLFGSHFGSFEVGGKIRNGNKRNQTYEPVYVATKNPALSYSEVLGNVKDPDFYFGNYALPPLSDYNKILALLAANPSALTLDVNATHSRSDPNFYHTNERVYAGYAMNTLAFGHARIQTGLRFETTQSNFLGYHVTFDSNGDYVSTEPVRGNNTYTNVLPSIQFQYAFTPSTNLRAGYGRGIARPNFSDLPPFVIENDRGPGQSVTLGNPTLRPTTANNFDLLLERYLKPVGIIQGGVFYKHLHDPIFSVTSPDPLTNGPFAGFSATQPTNGTRAHIFGVEASYQQLLTFLPGPLNGFGVFANYSYTTSRAVVPNRAIDPALARQGPNNWNVDVTYDKRRLSTRLGLTHNDAYIYLYGFQNGAALGIRGPHGDQYTYAHTQLDLQGSYRLHAGLKFIASFLNLNNEVFGFYQGSPIYPIQREFYGRTYMFGLRWTNLKE
jgi:TonB-dependent receptor